MAARGHRAKAKALAERATGKKDRADLRFWLKDEPHQAVWSNAKRIGSRTRARRMQDMYFACLYDDAELATALGGTQAIGEFTPQTLATNIVRRQVDTFTAKVSKNRPLPMGLTTGGNYQQQRRAKSLSKFFAGVLDEVKFWPTRTLRLRDSGIFGSGIALNWRDGKTLKHDRVFPWEIRVDPREAQHGNPRSMYMLRLVDRLVAMERFPEFEEELEDASSWFDESQSGANGLDDMNDLVLLIEAWHLPSGPDATDGAHVICTDNATLRNDDYIRDYFPISKFDYAPALVGWNGEGIVKQLHGLQYEVNSVGLRLQERHYLMGTYVLRHSGAHVDYESVDNGTMTEIVYDGPKPDWLAPPAAHPQLFEWFQFLRGTMPADVTGFSSLSTRSEIPKGLEGSGKAQRVYHDIETEGLTPQGRADEQDVIDTCWQYFDLAEEIYGEGIEAKRKKKKEEHYTVRIEQRTHGRSELQELSYKDVRLDREKFTLRVFPTNFLTGTPEEKFASVQEMIQAGFLSQDEAIVLLDFPDLEHVTNLRGAARRVIERILDKIRDASDPEGAYEYPEPAMDLNLCKALGQMNYLDAKLDGVDQKNLKWLLQFAIDAAAMLSGEDLGPRPDGSPPPDMPPQNLGAPPGAPPPGAPPGAGPPGLYAPPDQPLLAAGAVAPQGIPPTPPM